MGTQILADHPPDGRAQAFSRAMHASRAALRMTYHVSLAPFLQETTHEGASSPYVE